MKWLLLLVGCLTYTGALPLAFAQELDERIHDFQSEITLSQDGSMTVQETIVYDFGAAQKHGMFRFIPDTIQPDGYKRANLGIQSSGEVLRNGRLEPSAYTLSNDLHEWKIGSPTVFVSDIQIYAIPYTVNRIIVNETDRQRFSWNVTGNDWRIPIQSPVAFIDVPRPPIETRCYVGVRGSEEEHCTVRVEGTRIIAQSTRLLAPTEGLTVTAFFPPETFTGTVPLTPKPLIPEWVWVALAYNLLWFGLWYAFGRDGRGVVIAEYAPPKDLRPIDAAYLMHDGMHPRVLAAFLTDLVERGFVRIEPLGGVPSGLDVSTEAGKKTLKKHFAKGLVIERTGKTDGLTANEEAWLNDLLGGDTRRTLGHRRDVSFASDVQYMATKLHAYAVEQGWYDRSPHRTKVLWVMGAVFGGMIPLYIGFWWFMDDPSQIFFLFFSITILPILFAMKMGRYTPKGEALYKHLLGFKRYIRVAEKARIEFHNAPQMTIERFTELLPYAVALGEEERFSKLLSNAVQTSLQSASSSSSAYSSSLAAATMSSALASSLSSSLASSSGSSGGGSSSGGGGGGGGGGSW